MSNQRTNQKPKGIWREIYELLESFAVAIVLVVLIFTILFRIFVVQGPSMESTLNNEDRIMVSNLFYTPKTGDIIVFSDEGIKQDNGHDEVLVKRVIATEGQTVDITEQGIVTVDGTALEEPYLDFGTITAPRDVEMPCKVGKGEIFVMGDHREVSADSRYQYVGMADANKVLGKVILRLFPNFGVIKNGK